MAKCGKCQNSDRTVRDRTNQIGPGKIAYDARRADCAAPLRRHACPWGGAASADGADVRGCTHTTAPRRLPARARNAQPRSKRDFTSPSLSGSPGSSCIGRTSCTACATTSHQGQSLARTRDDGQMQGSRRTVRFEDGSAARGGALEEDAAAGLQAEEDDALSESWDGSVELLAEYQHLDPAVLDEIEEEAVHLVQQEQAGVILSASGSSASLDRIPSRSASGTPPRGGQVISQGSGSLAGSHARFLTPARNSHERAGSGDAYTAEEDEEDAVLEDILIQRLRSRFGGARAILSNFASWPRMSSSCTDRLPSCGASCSAWTCSWTSTQTLFLLAPYLAFSISRTPQWCTQISTTRSRTLRTFPR